MTTVPLRAGTTRWRLVQVTDLAGRRVRNLDVIVTVDTRAPSVIGPIENAAAYFGIILQPIIDDHDEEVAGLA